MTMRRMVVVLKLVKTEPETTKARRSHPRRTGLNIASGVRYENEYTTGDTGDAMSGYTKLHSSIATSSIMALPVSAR